MKNIFSKTFIMVFSLFLLTGVLYGCVDVSKTEESLSDSLQEFYPTTTNAPLEQPSFDFEPDVNFPDDTNDNSTPNVDPDDSTDANVTQSTTGNNDVTTDETTLENITQEPQPGDDTPDPNLIVHNMSDKVSKSDSLIGIGIYVDIDNAFPYSNNQKIYGTTGTNQFGETTFTFGKFKAFLLSSLNGYESAVPYYEKCFYDIRCYKNEDEYESYWVLEAIYSNARLEGQQIYCGLIYDGAYGPYLVVDASPKNVGKECLVGAISFEAEISVVCQLFIQSDITSLIEKIDIESYNAPGELIKTKSIDCSTLTTGKIMELNSDLDAGGVNHIIIKTYRFDSDTPSMSQINSGQYTDTMYQFITINARGESNNIFFTYKQQTIL